MSLCEGRVYCKIYRDKKFCQKRREREGSKGVCDCRHARCLCEVSDCVLSGSCYDYARMNGGADDAAD